MAQRTSDSNVHYCIVDNAFYLVSVLLLLLLGFSIRESVDLDCTLQ